MASSSFLDNLLDANKKQFGKGVITGTNRYVVGLEPYSLALQYMLDLQVMPLQSIIVFAGEPKSYKTSALLDALYGCIKAGGIGIVTHTEGKWSHSKAMSMMKGYEDQLVVIPAKSVEDWQRATTNTLNGLKAMTDKWNSINNKQKKTKEDKEFLENVELNRPRPVFCGVDSLTGSQTENLTGKVTKEGIGSKTFQDRALVNWQWFNTWSSGLLGIPATVIITQHLKPKLDGQGSGPVQMVTAGGSGSTFMCSFEIRTKRIREIKTAKYEGALLQWQTHFSSYGRDKRKIQIPYIETYDEQGNQLAYFDWDAALVHLLIALKDEPLFRERVLETVGNVVEYSSNAGKVYTCNALNISGEVAKEQGITASVLGQMLQQPGSEMRAKLQKALLVQPAELWTPETVL